MLTYFIISGIICSLVTCFLYNKILHRHELIQQVGLPAMAIASGLLGFVILPFWVLMSLRSAFRKVKKILFNN